MFRVLYGVSDRILFNEEFHTRKIRIRKKRKKMACGSRVKL